MGTTAETTYGVLTPNCDKELAAREERAGEYARFLAWAGAHGWRFCVRGRSDGFVPVEDRLVAKLVPTPDAGGSQEIGDFLDIECGEAGLALCRHQESNADAVREATARTELGRKRMRGAFWSPTVEDSYQPEGWFPVYNRVEQVLAAFYGIDLEASSREREAILRAFRASNERGA